MLSTSIPSYLWGDAILTAAHLINRMSSQALKFQTPLDSFKESYPNTRLLSVVPIRDFGCVMFVHTHGPNQTKFTPRAQKCIFVGYPLHQHGYKCYHPSSKKILYFVSINGHSSKIIHSFPNGSLQGENTSEETNWGPSLSVFLEPILDISTNESIRPTKQVPWITYYRRNLRKEIAPSVISLANEDQFQVLIVLSLIMIINVIKLMQNPSLTLVPMNPFARPNKSHGSHIIGGILGRKWRRLLFLWQRRSVPGTNSPIPDHDNECDKTDACVENIESNNREDNDSKDVIEAENDDCETLVPAKNVVQPGKEMSPAPAENIVESGKMTEHGTFEQEGECSMKPKESKDRNVSLDLSIALRKGTRSCTKYPLQSYLSYSNLSPEFKALTTNLDTVVIPNSIHTALESRSHGRNCGSREKSYVRPSHSSKWS
ncbi:uncharacterized protein LOC120082554 isoform X1 [Benincasa hispida]|uniref:uncharacterized protein LOC120082554 isoform X1 n=1 Tax=Benincasa hispida TaxID=102211 RepID=UPI00190024F9|nr:uncharacterized protein LOC120082554 isoform X1 [Benincasa hispida]